METISLLEKDLFWNKQRKIFQYCKEQTSFNPEKGPRELILSLIEMSLAYINHEKPDDDLLEMIANNILGIATKNPLEFFYQNIEGVKNDGYISIKEVQKKVKSFMSKKNAKNHLFNNVEKLMMTQVSTSISMEFLTMMGHQVPDYGMMKINYQFLYEVLKEGLPNSPIPFTVTLYTDTGNTLVSWDFQYRQLSEKYRDGLPVFFEHKPLDDLENEYEKLRTQYAYLSKSSLQTLATALAQEKRLDKSKDLMSYTGLCISYLGTIEKELRNIALFADKELSQSKKRMMWRDLVNYYEKNGFEAFLYEHELQQSWIDNLKQLNPLRNKAAHGEFISLEEFKSVKQFTLNSKLLDWISYYKYHYQLLE